MVSRPIAAWAMVLGLFLGTVGVPRVRAEVFDAAIKPVGSDNFLLAEFRCYLPPAVDPVRGVAVLVPAYNEDGRNLAADPAWTTFADKNQVALLACHFQGDAGHDYSNARRGSGQALVRVLRDLSVQTRRRELGNANFMLWGVSSGAQFAATMAMEKPDRTLGFVAVLGAYWLSADAQARKVPGLFISSRDQADGAVDRTRKHFTDSRTLGANWAYFETGSSTEALEGMQSYGQDFISGSMAARQRAESAPGSNLQTLSQKDCWVVPHDREAGSPIPSVELPRNALPQSSSFPSRELGEKWIVLKNTRWATGP